MKKVLTVIVALVLLIVGGCMIYSGFNQEPEHTPDIAAPVEAKPGQKAEGPTISKVRPLDIEVKDGDKEKFDPITRKDTGVEKDSDSVTMSPKNMEKNTLFIPSIESYARIDRDTGKIVGGTLTLPKASRVTQWDKGSDVDSKKGNIVMAGHVSMSGIRGALYNLAYVKPGEIAYVKNNEGVVKEFKMKSMIPIKKSALPQNIWKQNGSLQLIVITCGGELHQVTNGTWHFDNNIVATFVPLDEQEEGTAKK